MVTFTKLNCLYGAFLVLLLYNIITTAFFVRLALRTNSDYLYAMTQLRQAKGQLAALSLGINSHKHTFKSHGNLNDIFSPKSPKSFSDVAIHTYNNSLLVLAYIRSDIGFSSVWHVLLDQRSFRPITVPSILPIKQSGFDISKHVFVEPTSFRLFEGPARRIYISYVDKSNNPDRERAMWVTPVDNPIEAVEIDLPVRMSPSSAELNWMFWTLENQQYASYSLQPHVVLDIHLVSGHTSIAYNTTYPIDDYFDAYSKTRYFLSTPPILLRRSYSAFPPIFLAIFSTSPSPSRKHFAYSFSAAPPFQLLGVSMRALVLPCVHTRDVVTITSLALLRDSREEEREEREDEESIEVMLGYVVNGVQVHFVVTTVGDLLKDLVSAEMLDQNCNV